MSTEFYIKDRQNNDDRLTYIALRFYGGVEQGKTVRFNFDSSLLNYVRAVEIIGENSEILTIGSLYESATSVEFIASDLGSNFYRS